MEGQASGEKKSKAELKAERRAKQEAQRAAKAARQGDGAVSEGGSAGKSKSDEGQKPQVKLTQEEQLQAKKEKASRKSQNKPQKQPTPSTTKTPGASSEASSSTAESSASVAPTSASSTSLTSQQQSVVTVSSTVRLDEPAQQRKHARNLGRQKVTQRTHEKRRVGLLQHLPQYDKREHVLRGMSLGHLASIHPAFLELGVRMDEGLLYGSNARCLAFLAALRTLISEYNQPKHVDLGRDLCQILQRHATFLDQCRPLAVSMRTAISDLKIVINGLDKDSSDGIKRVQESMDDFISERIESAGTAISLYAANKIKSGDIVMVYGYSSLVARVLQKAVKEDKKSIRVLIADARPRLDGKKMVAEMKRLEVPCLYTDISAVPTYMSQVSMVIMGAHALLSNGYVISRIGTGYVANVAAAFNKPLFICCETYKFWERAQTDAFEYNELCNPEDLVAPSDNGVVSCLANWRETTTKLSLLNLSNDVISHDLANVVVTELGMIPTTSVPVVMRVKRIGVV